MGLTNAAGKIEFDVLVGAPGSGKSIALRDEAFATPGLYLFCLPTIPLIEEQAAKFRELRPDLQVIEARSGAGGGRGKVQRQLDDHLVDLENAGTAHAIIFMTHESMMSCDLSGFTDWHVRIDEVPNAIQTGKMNIRTKLSEGFFSSTFDLDPSGDWAHARLKTAAGNWRDQAQDSLVSQQTEFLKYAARPQGVHVSVLTWKGTKTFEWFALWSPTFLSHVRSLKIAAAAYLDSIGAKACLHWWKDDVEIKQIAVPAVPVPRSGEPTIRVHYFTEGHEGTTTLWGKSEGRKLIKAVCDHLVDHVPNLAFWSGNDEVRNLMEWRAPGLITKPKVAGSNIYRDLQSCAFIYSSKPLPSDGPLRNLFKMTEADILAAREDEDIHQFIMRGAIRNEGYGGDYDVYLYSRRQAEALAAKLGAGFAKPIQVMPLDGAGIMADTLKKSAPQSPSKAAEPPKLVPGAKGKGERLAKSAQRQAQRRQKKISN